jgi:hypothetical protein
MNQNEFPPLQPPTSRVNPWKQSSTQPLVTSNTNESEDSMKILLSINKNLLEMKENTHRIDEKLDRINEKVNQTALDTELHQETLVKLLPTLLSIVSDFIWPMMNYNIAGLGSKQPELQKLFTSIESLGTRLKSDYTSRRKRAVSPLPRLSPAQQSSKPSNNTLTNESGHNMNT